ncbi:MAG: hypothetical protein M1292_14995 [Bacteroidetes bacterium]|nr:hypothetical protein [Bacteroidota bacterium]
MKFSDFTALIQIIISFYFASFGLRIAKTISQNKYNDILAKKETFRNYIEYRSRKRLNLTDWERFNKIDEYVKRFDNQFDHSRKIYEEIFIFSGLYGLIILFSTVFYDNNTLFVQLNNTGLLYFNLSFIFILITIFIKLFKKEIKPLSTIRILEYTLFLIFILAISIILNSCIIFSFLDNFSHENFILATLMILSFPYFLFYAQWKYCTRRLAEDLPSIDALANEFVISTENYLNENIKI